MSEGLGADRLKVSKAQGDSEIEVGGPEGPLDGS
jgi:hypothetical protein